MVRTDGILAPLFLLAGLALALLWGGVWLETAYDRAHTMRAAHGHNAVLAQAMEEHAVSTLRQVEDLLGAIASRIGKAMPVEVLDLHTDRSLVVGFGAYDARGRLVLAENLGAFPEAEEAEFFAVPARRRGAAVHIGLPVRDPRVGWMLVPVSRAIVSADGTFLGVAVAMVDPDFFSSFYAFLGLPAGGTVALARRDGTVLARQSLAGGPEAGNLHETGLWRALQSTPRGTFESRGDDDGGDRLYAFRIVERQPLIVLVGAAGEQVLRLWRQRLHNILAAAALITLAVCGLTAALARQVLRRRRVDAALVVRDRAIASSNDGIAILDRRGAMPRIIYCNAAFQRITGYDEAQAFAAGCAVLVGPHQDPARQTLLEALRHGGAAAVERPSARRDGSPYWSELHLAPVRDGHGAVTHLVAVLRDVTERRHAADALRAAKEQAETANRTKSEFLANMSHELRTPLNAILGFAEILDHGIAGPVTDKQREYLADIHHSGRHLLEIIGDILDISKIEAGRVELRDELIDVHILVQTCLGLMRPRAELAGVRLGAELPEPIPLLRGDEVRIKQVLLNLLSNAVKFTAPGGSVTIRVVRHGAGLAIAVADTGIGMDADEVALALLPFRQVEGPLNRRHEGTGLGLPLSKSLVELHGGRLDVLSRKGVGTTVVASFPRTEPPLPPTAEPLLASRTG